MADINESSPGGLFAGAGAAAVEDAANTLTEEQVKQIVVDLLTAGTNISLDPETTDGITINNTQEVEPNTDTTYSLELQAGTTNLSLVDDQNNRYNVQITAGDNVTLSNNDGELVISAANDGMDYVEGNGINIVGNVISHADTSSQSSISNTGSTVIQSITLDDYGHVVGLTSHTVELDSALIAGDGIEIEYDSVEDEYTIINSEPFNEGDKTKLSGIEVEAQRNVKSDWNETDPGSDAYILNKPDINPGDVNVQANWNETDSANDSYIQNKPLNLTDFNNDLPQATPSADGIMSSQDKAKLDTITAGADITLNEISAGDGISIDSDGVITATGGGEGSTPRAAGDGLTLTDNTLSVTDPVTPNDRSRLNSANLTDLINASDPVFTDTTYTAGVGVNISGVNVIDVENPFTAADKSKLDGIEANAEVNVQADWNETDTTSDAYIRNKPASGTMLTAGAGIDISDSDVVSLDANISDLNDVDTAIGTGDLIKYDSDSGEWNRGGLNIGELSDVNIVSPQEDYILSYHSGNWEAHELNMAIEELQDIGNIGAPGDSPSNGDYLRYNESDNVWEYVSVDTVEGLSNLSDVTISDLQDNQFLRYDSASNEWRNENLPEGAIYDAGTGLALDDSTNTFSLDSPLSGLNDVSSATPSNAQVLTYNDGVWAPADTLSSTIWRGDWSSAETYNNGDIVHYTPDDHVYVWTGSADATSANVPGTDSDWLLLSLEAQALNDLTNVTATDATDGYVLRADGTNYVISQLSYNDLSNQLTTFTSSADGLVPQSGSNNSTDYFLAGDGNWTHLNNSVDNPWEAMLTAQMRRLVNDGTTPVNWTTTISVNPGENQVGVAFDGTSTYTLRFRDQDIEDSFELLHVSLVRITHGTDTGLYRIASSEESFAFDTPLANIFHLMDTPLAGTDVLNNIGSGQTVQLNFDTAHTRTYLNELHDVTIDTPESGQVVRHNGTNWVNAQLNYSDLAGTPGGGGDGAILLGGKGVTIATNNNQDTFSVDLEPDSGNTFNAAEFVGDDDNSDQLTVRYTTTVNDNKTYINTIFGNTVRGFDDTHGIEIATFVFNDIAFTYAPRQTLYWDQPLSSLNWTVDNNSDFQSEFISQGVTSIDGTQVGTFSDNTYQESQSESLNSAALGTHVMDPRTGQYTGTSGGTRNVSVVLTTNMNNTDTQTSSYSWAAAGFTSTASVNFSTQRFDAIRTSYTVSANVRNTADFSNIINEAVSVDNGGGSGSLSISSTSVSSTITGATIYHDTQASGNLSADFRRPTTVSAETESNRTTSDSAGWNRTPTTLYPSFAVLGSDQGAFDASTDLGTLSNSGYSATPRFTSTSTSNWHSNGNQFTYSNSGASAVNGFLVVPSTLPSDKKFINTSAFGADFDIGIPVETALGHDGHTVNYQVYTFTIAGGATAVIEVTDA